MMEVVKELPRRIADALIDPLRRRNVIWRITESIIGLIVVATLGWKWIPLAVLMEFLAYELVAEPSGWTGPYWERGPRDGEEFTRP